MKLTEVEIALGGAGDSTSRYMRVYDYSEAYVLIAWGQASGHAWDRLECIAQEYERGEYGWDRAAELVDDTVREVYA